MRQTWVCRLLPVVFMLALAAPVRGQAFGFAWWRDAQFQHELALTADQSARIDAIFQAAISQLRAKKDELDKQEDLLSQQIASGADEGLVTRQVEKVEAIRSQMNKMRTLMLLKERQVLSPDQRVKLNKLHEQWYNFTMRDSARPSFLKNKVAYYITNKDVWKYVGSLDEIGKEKKLFYLGNNDGRANDLLQSGTLAETSTNSPPSQYVYDPLDKTSALFDLRPSDNYLTDQTYAFNISKFGLVFHSRPFEQDQEVSGFFELETYIETDVPDIDVEADIYELKQDGTSILLTSAIMRARYRESLEVEKLMEPGKTYLVPFHNFTFISRTIEKGSRLRLLLSSPNSMNVEKNYGTGGVVAQETGKGAKPAHVKIYHAGDKASVLKMPIMK